MFVISPSRNTGQIFPSTQIRLSPCLIAGMMAAVGAARHDRLAPYLKPGHLAIGSINSPMQCMMKEICAQCLQRHEDPETGKESFVFSCFNQDQPLDMVDFENLNQRLRQNSVAEKLSNLWLDYLISKRELHTVE